jgi:hypothetical protein
MRYGHRPRPGRRGRSALRSGSIVKVSNQIPPPAVESFLKTREVIDGHVPLTSFDALERPQVDISKFCELLLGELLSHSESMNRPPDKDMRFG